MDGPKQFQESREPTRNYFLLLGWTDGWVIEIIGFKLLTKGRDIRSASNVERNTIPDGGSYVAKSLAGKTFSKGAEKLEGVLRTGAGRGRLKSKMST